MFEKVTNAIRQYVINDKDLLDIKLNEEDGDDKKQEVIAILNSLVNSRDLADISVDKKFRYRRLARIIETANDQCGYKIYDVSEDLAGRIRAVAALEDAEFSSNMVPTLTPLLESLQQNLKTALVRGRGAEGDVVETIKGLVSFYCNGGSKDEKIISGLVEEAVRAGRIEYGAFADIVATVLEEQSAGNKANFPKVCDRAVDLLTSLARKNPQLAPSQENFERIFGLLNETQKGMFEAGLAGNVRRESTASAALGRRNPTTIDFSSEAVMARMKIEMGRQQRASTVSISLEDAKRLAPELAKAINIGKILLNLDRLEHDSLDDGDKQYELNDGIKKWFILVRGEGDNKTIFLSKDDGWIEKGDIALEDLVEIGKMIHLEIEKMQGDEESERWSDSEEEELDGGDIPEEEEYEAPEYEEPIALDLGGEEQALVDEAVIIDLLLQNEKAKQVSLDPSALKGDNFLIRRTRLSISQGDKVVDKAQCYSIVAPIENYTSKEAQLQDTVHLLVDCGALDGDLTVSALQQGRISYVKQDVSAKPQSQGGRPYEDLSDEMMRELGSRLRAALQRSESVASSAVRPIGASSAVGGSRNSGPHHLS